MEQLNDWYIMFMLEDVCDPPLWSTCYRIVATRTYTIHRCCVAGEGAMQKCFSSECSISVSHPSEILIQAATFEISILVCLRIAFQHCDILLQCPGRHRKIIQKKIPGTVVWCQPFVMGSRCFCCFPKNSWLGNVPPGLAMLLHAGKLYS